MDFKVTWSPSARSDLKEIISYLAEDNVEIARHFGYSLIESTKSLVLFPKRGRIVPELKNPEIREIIFKSYRIIYRLKESQGLVEIVRVWHAARGKPEH
jgi:toxin ParE1/3/4